MGQTLCEPVTTKKSACCRDSNYRVGSSCMQGWRIKMEDCHVHILSLPDDPGTAFFAVYDGHGGNNIFVFCISNTKWVQVFHVDIYIVIHILHLI